MATTEKINLGIYNNTSLGRIEIKMKPNYNITTNDIISEIKFTLRWVSSGISLIPQPPIAPFNLSPQGGPVKSGSYYYQTFIAILGNNFIQSINAGQEVIIAILDYKSKYKTTIAMVSDAYTKANNLDYYFEVNGLNKTGTIYPYSITLTPLTINLGIFKSVISNKVEIRMKPDYNITTKDIISEIKFTIRWSGEGFNLIPDELINPFNLSPQGTPIKYGSYYYQTFIAILGNNFIQPIIAGQEVVIATFKYECLFKKAVSLINNTYTKTNNLDYYFEINGLNRTGSFYMSSVTLDPSVTNKIDIGIFKSITNKIDIKIRPNFNISANNTLSGIIFTVRWQNSNIVITNVNKISPFLVDPLGPVVLNNNNYYQIFGSVPMLPIGTDILAGTEKIISSFTYTGDGNLELINDSWTRANNGDVYLELLGVDNTGIIYSSIV